MKIFLKKVKKKVIRREKCSGAAITGPGDTNPSNDATGLLFSQKSYTHILSRAWVDALPGSSYRLQAITLG